ncbi:hypothetical protein BDV93DRAFT_125019 [Ceratobasidium sp. AG-I]|nr:hypothetical protein BDV93DRAFT_125019 [Ceratobasidium sp. AG-I]
MSHMAWAATSQPLGSLESRHWASAIPRPPRETVIVYGPDSRTSLSAILHPEIPLERIHQSVSARLTRWK